MKILQYQFWHLLFLVLSFVILKWLMNMNLIDLSGGLWGIETKTWFFIAILSPIVHQIYVVICWRLELYNQLISKTFGKQLGFKLYKIGFAILILSRIVTITLLAFSSQHTFEFNPIVIYALSFILFLLSAYLFYSVIRYFGMDRAFGIDHFEPENSKLVPMVKKGIFKYTSNGMYVFGFMILWIPGLICFSKAAIAVALFQHIYIWIHFYFTEEPDMKYIYGDN